MPESLRGRISLINRCMRQVTQASVQFYIEHSCVHPHFNKLLLYYHYNHLGYELETLKKRFLWSENHKPSLCLAALSACRMLFKYTQQETKCSD